MRSNVFAPLAMSLLALLAPVYAAPAAAAATPSCTRTAGFDNLPTGTVSPSTNINGITLDGWSVLKAQPSTTFFNAFSPNNLLRLDGTKGNISAAQGHLFNPANYYFGCAVTNSSGVFPITCGYTVTFPIPDPFVSSPVTQFDVFYDGKPNGTRGLDWAGSFAPSNSAYCTFELDNPSPGLHLYIDQFVYEETNCSN